MYRCQVCGAQSRPKQARLVHVVYRELPHVRYVRGVPQAGTRREIAREVPVCPDCHGELGRGVSLQSLLSYYEPVAAVAPPAPAPPARPTTVPVPRPPAQPRRGGALDLGDTVAEL